MPHVSELSGVWWLAAASILVSGILLAASSISRKIEKEREEELATARKAYMEANARLQWIRQGKFYEPTEEEMSMLLEFCERQMAQQ